MKCHLLSFLDCWDRTTLVAKSKLFTLTLSGAVMLKEAKTRVMIIAVEKRASYIWKAMDQTLAIFNRTIVI